MNDNERFDVHWKDPDGHWHTEREGASAKDAVTLAHSLSTRPAAAIAIIREIRITDTEDFCVFLWRSDEGVVFPTHDSVAAAGIQTRGAH